MLCDNKGESLGTKDKSLAMSFVIYFLSFLTNADDVVHSYTKIILPLCAFLGHATTKREEMVVI